MSHAPQRKHALDLTAMAVLVVLCASWGLQQVSVKIAMPDVSPVMQSAIRSIGASLLLLIWMNVRRQPVLARDGSLWWGIGAGVLFSGEFALLYWGLNYTTAARAVVFMYLSPFVVALGAQLFLPGENLRFTQVVGLLCAFGGIVFAFGGAFEGGGDTLLGDVMIASAAVLWGATTVLIKAGRLTAIAPAKTLLYQLGLSALVMLPLSWALGEPGIQRLSLTAVLSLVYQTVWVAAITYAIWFWLINQYPASALSSFTFLTPVFGVIAGWLVLDEDIGQSLLIALALIATGIYLVNRRSNKVP